MAPDDWNAGGEPTDVPPNLRHAELRNGVVGEAGGDARRGLGVRCSRAAGADAL